MNVKPGLSYIGWPRSNLSMPVRINSSRGRWGSVRGGPFPPVPHPVYSAYFRWPAPTNWSTAQALLEARWHTHRKLSLSYLPKAVRSQSAIAAGMWKPSCLALKPGHTLRCTFHSRSHCLLTLRLGFCLKSRLCLASFLSGPASPLPPSAASPGGCVLNASSVHMFPCQDLLWGSPP